jgi:hypothetical protein
MQAEGVEVTCSTCAVGIDAWMDQPTIARNMLKKALALGIFAAPVPTSASSWALDLGKHSEGSAVTAVRWWLEEEIHPRLSEQPSSAYPDTTVELITGRGKHGKVWDTTGIKQAVIQALAEMEVPTKPHSEKGFLAIDCDAWVQQSRE